MVASLFLYRANHVITYTAFRIVTESHQRPPALSTAFRQPRSRTPLWPHHRRECPGRLAPSVPRDNTIARRRASQGGEGVCLKPCQSVTRCTGGVPLSVARHGVFVGELDSFWSCVTSHKMIMIAPRRSNMPHERRIAESDCSQRKLTRQSPATVVARAALDGEAIKMKRCSR